MEFVRPHALSKTIHLHELTMAVLSSMAAHIDLICVDLAIQGQQPSHMQIGS